MARSTVAKSLPIFLMTNTFETGGSERQFSVLAQSLKPEDFKVHLGCVRRDGPFASGFGEVPEFRLGGSLFGWKSFAARLRLAQHLRRTGIRIAHAFDLYTNLTLIPAARLARVPVVIGSHRQLGDLLTPAQFRAQAIALRWCDMVVCNSHAAAGRLAADGVARRKLVVIGNALADEAFSTARPAIPRRSGVLRVGMVARMNARYKNHSGFLRIASRVALQSPASEFVLAGDGPLRQELEQEAQALGIRERVAFLGDRRDIPAVLASLDLAVLTSDSESLSNVVLEAMAARLPVVAYDVGGNAELVNDQRGTLVPAGDETRFAEAILRLLSEAHVRHELGANAHRFVAENFSLDHVRQSYEELYRALLAKKDPGSRAA